MNILVLDECSLVSVTTFSAMFDMLMSEAKVHCSKSRKLVRQSITKEITTGILLIIMECVCLKNLINSCYIDLQIQKLVLLGDILQLPSIEPGNFLTDVFYAMDAIGCSVFLRTNHRSDGELITANAGLLNFN